MSNARDTKTNLLVPMVVEQTNLEIRPARTIEHGSLTKLREKLVRIDVKMVRHGRYVKFQMAVVAVSRRMFRQILSRITRLRAPPLPA